MTDAESVARAFAEEGRHLVRGIGTVPRVIREHSAADGFSFFSVRMFGGGTIFLSGDDRYEPVIAFSSADIDFDNLDRQSPLYALLDGDPRARRAATVANVRWRRLLALGDRSPGYPSLLSAVNLAASLVEPGDVRVPALLVTQWNQGSAGGGYCFNYHTPNHAVCGCVATAVSQVLRHHRWPDAGHPVAQGTFDCSYNGVATNLTVEGGAYDWDGMPAGTAWDPISSLEHRQAIGKLTSDVGISVNMNYTTSDNGSAAYVADVADALMDVWHYGQATYFLDYADYGYGYLDGVHGATARARTLQKVLLSNFDCGCPVVLGIGRNGTKIGHCIVADGYGYENGVDYVHLNMGWSGMSDLWYNLPSIGTGSGFDTVVEAVYNVFPTNGTTCATFSGRIVDTETNGVAFARVTICRSGTSEVVAETVATQSGVYGAVLPGGESYDVVAVSSDLARTGRVSQISLAAPVVEYWEDWGCHRIVTAIGSLGNSWGNDVVLVEPASHRSTPTNLYVSASCGADAPDRGTLDAPYATIQYALTNGQLLVAGDVVNVLPGTYFGCVEAPSVTMSIVSTGGPDVTTLDGNGIDCCYYGEVNPETLLAGFTLRNGACQYGGGALCGTLSNCVITSCQADFGGGACDVKLLDCRVYGNAAYYSGGGAYGAKLQRCTVFGNMACYGGGSGVDYRCACSNSIVWANYNASGSLDNWQKKGGFKPAVPQMGWCCTTPSGYGGGTGCIDADPLFANAEACDFRLREGSPCLGAGENGVNMGFWQGPGLRGFTIVAEAVGGGRVTPTSAFVIEGESATFTASDDHPFLGFATNGVFASQEPVFTWTDVRTDGVLRATFESKDFYVDAVSGDDAAKGWTAATAKRTLQAAVDVVGAGETIHVGPGTYGGIVVPPETTNLVIVSTTGAAQTTIDGGGTMRCLDDYATTRLEGFTLTHGAAANGYGGGACCGTLVLCVISNCTAAAGGGAAGSELQNCLVLDNVAAYSGGGVYECGLFNSTVVANRASQYGGGAILDAHGCAVNTIVATNVCTQGFANGNDVYGSAYWTMVCSISDQDAKFVDAEHGDYRLAARSPCIDAGTNEFVTVFSDLVGTNRIVGAHVDMGCYEYCHVPKDWPTPSVEAGATSAEEAAAVSLSMEEAGFSHEQSSAVTTLRQYNELTAWSEARGVGTSAMAASSTALISAALDANALLTLTSEDVRISDLAIGSDATEWTMKLPLTPFYDAAKVSPELLKAAVGVVGNEMPTGDFSAEGLGVSVTPKSDAVEITVTPPAGKTAYFMKSVVR